MNYNSGGFFCPQCGNKEFQGCKTWLSKTEYIYNSPQQKWIIYKDKNDCVCCLGWYFCCDKYSCYKSNRKCIKCSPCEYQNYICFPFYFLFLILYLIFCSIADICNICCCKYLEYEDTYDDRLSDKRYVLAKNDIEIWKECKGFTSENKYSSDVFKCDNCGYATKNFLDFIDSNTVTVNNNTDIPFLDEYQNITVNFTSGSINCPITCKLTDKFSFIENLFYIKNPDYKFQNCYFMAKGSKLNPYLTLAEQGIQNGENIIICSMN